LGPSLTLHSAFIGSFLIIFYQLRLLHMFPWWHVLCWMWLLLCMPCSRVTSRNCKGGSKSLH
jgi:hypothetical protein